MCLIAYVGMLCASGVLIGYFVLCGVADGLLLVVCFVGFVRWFAVGALLMFLTFVGLLSVSVIRLVGWVGCGVALCWALLGSGLILC